MEVGGEFPHHLGSFLIDTHRRDPESAAAERIVEPLHGGHFDFAGHAPGGPDVHQGHVASIVLPYGNRITGCQIHRAVVGRLGSDRDLLDVGTGPDQCRASQYQPGQDRADEYPLFGHDYALSVQRRLSPRTASAMSGCPKTAVPATKVSAPARHADSMVSRVIP